MVEPALPRRAAPEERPEPSLTATRLVVRRGDKSVLNDIGFQLWPGRRHALVGAIGEAANEGRTVVISSHELAPLSRCCDDLLVLDEGRLTYSGTIEVLIAGSSPERVLVRTPTRPASPTW